jgi:NADP-dependent 3-hydroxy acid dehydrogenase YdfG
MAWFLQRPRKRKMSKVVVITGSTKGVGLDMARSLLDQGYSVAISSHNKTNVIRVLEELKPAYGSKVWGAVCAVEDYLAVQSLWNTAKAYFGYIDVWINNAAMNCKRCNSWELDGHTIYDIVNTNITGTLNGLSVAVSGMLLQGGGQIFNMNTPVGDGSPVSGRGVYSSTLYAIRYITDVLVKELEGKPVTADFLVPGMLPVFR